MELDVFCDESGIEALKDKKAHKYLTIGGIWIPSECRHELKNDIKKLKVEYSVFGELKWKKTSIKNDEFYKKLILLFFEKEWIKFRAIIIESEKLNHEIFNKSDSELGFYKFYYQLLHHWIFENNNYSIFIDLKTNRDINRIPTLKSILQASNLSSKIKNLQALPSEQSSGIQFADFLIGLVAAKFNDSTGSKYRTDLINHFEYLLGSKISPTEKTQEKFNIFRIILKSGAW